MTTTDYRLNIYTKDYEPDRKSIFGILNSIFDGDYDFIINRKFLFPHYLTQKHMTANNNRSYVMNAMDILFNIKEFRYALHFLYAKGLLPDKTNYELENAIFNMFYLYYERNVEYNEPTNQKLPDPGDYRSLAYVKATDYYKVKKVVERVNEEITRASELTGVADTLKQAAVDATGKTIADAVAKYPETITAPIGSGVAIFTAAIQAICDNIDSTIKHNGDGIINHDNRNEIYNSIIAAGGNPSIANAIIGHIKSDVLTVRNVANQINAQGTEDQINVAVNGNDVANAVIADVDAAAKDDDIVHHDAVAAATGAAAGVAAIAAAIPAGVAGGAAAPILAKVAARAGSIRIIEKIVGFITSIFEKQAKRAAKLADFKDLQNDGQFKIPEKPAAGKLETYKEYNDFENIVIKDFHIKSIENGWCECDYADGNYLKSDGKLNGTYFLIYIVNKLDLIFKVFYNVSKFKKLFKANFDYNDQQPNIISMMYSDIEYDEKKHSDNPKNELCENLGNISITDMRNVGCNKFDFEYGKYVLFAFDKEACISSIKNPTFLKNPYIFISGKYYYVLKSYSIEDNGNLVNYRIGNNTLYETSDITKDNYGGTLTTAANYFRDKLDSSKRSAEIATFEIKAGAGEVAGGKVVDIIDVHTSNLRMLLYKRYEIVNPGKINLDVFDMIYKKPHEKKTRDSYIINIKDIGKKNSLSNVNIDIGAEPYKTILIPTSPLEKIILNILTKVLAIGEHYIKAIKALVVLDLEIYKKFETEEDNDIRKKYLIIHKLIDLAIYRITSKIAYDQDGASEFGDGGGNINIFKVNDKKALFKFYLNNNANNGKKINDDITIKNVNDPANEANDAELNTNTTFAYLYFDRYIDIIGSLNKLIELTATDVKLRRKYVETIYAMYSYGSNSKNFVYHIFKILNDLSDEELEKLDTCAITARNVVDVGNAGAANQPNLNNTNIRFNLDFKGNVFIHSKHPFDVSEKLGLLRLEADTEEEYKKNIERFILMLCESQNPLLRIFLCGFLSREATTGIYQGTPWKDNYNSFMSNEEKKSKYNKLFDFVDYIKKYKLFFEKGNTLLKIMAKNSVDIIKLIQIAINTVSQTDPDGGGQVNTTKRMIKAVVCAIIAVTVNKFSENTAITRSIAYATDAAVAVAADNGAIAANVPGANAAAIAAAIIAAKSLIIGRINTDVDTAYGAGGHNTSKLFYGIVFAAITSAHFAEINSDNIENKIGNFTNVIGVINACATAADGAGGANGNAGDAITGLITSIENSSTTDEINAAFTNAVTLIATAINSTRSADVNNLVDADTANKINAVAGGEADQIRIDYLKKVLSSVGHIIIDFIVRIISIIEAVGSISNDQDDAKAKIGRALRGVGTVAVAFISGGDIKCVNTAYQLVKNLANNQRVETIYTPIQICANIINEKISSFLFRHISEKDNSIANNGAIIGIANIDNDPFGKFIDAYAKSVSDLNNRSTFEILCACVNAVHDKNIAIYSGITGTVKCITEGADRSVNGKKVVKDINYIIESLDRLGGSGYDQIIKNSNINNYNINIQKFKGKILKKEGRNIYTLSTRVIDNFPLKGIKEKMEDDLGYTKSTIITYDKKNAYYSLYLDFLTKYNNTTNDDVCLRNFYKFYFFLVQYGKIDYDIFNEGNEDDKELRDIKYVKDILGEVNSFNDIYRIITINKAKDAKTVVGYNKILEKLLHIFFLFDRTKSDLNNRKLKIYKIFAYKILKKYFKNISRYRKILEIFKKISTLVMKNFDINNGDDNDVIKPHFDLMRSIINDIEDLLKTLEVYDYSPENYFRFHKLFVKIKYLKSFFRIDDNEEIQIANNYAKETPHTFYKEELRGRINIIVHDYFKEFCLDFVNFLNLRTNIDALHKDITDATETGNAKQKIILETLHLSNNDIVSDLNKLNYIDHIIFKIDYN